MTGPSSGVLSAAVEADPRVGLPASVALAIVSLEAVGSAFGGIALLIQALGNDATVNSGLGLGDVAGPFLLALLGLVLFRSMRVLSRLLEGGNATTKTDLAALLTSAGAHLAFFCAMVWFTISDPVDAKSNVVVLLVAAGGLLTGLVLLSAARSGRLDLAPSASNT